MSNLKIELSDDFEEAILSQVRQGLAEMEIDYECPECGAAMTIKPGETRACPKCGFLIAAEVGQPRLSDLWRRRISSRRVLQPCREGPPGPRHLPPPSESRPDRATLPRSKSFSGCPCAASFPVAARARVRFSKCQPSQAAPDGRLHATNGRPATAVYGAVGLRCPRTGHERRPVENDL